MYSYTVGCSKQNIHDLPHTPLEELKMIHPMSSAAQIFGLYPTVFHVVAQSRYNHFYVWEDA
jgi:hypothetical protein